MKLRGLTSVLAAGVAVGLVALVGASEEPPTLEAVPAPAVHKAPVRPAPGVDDYRSPVQDAFGDTDPTEYDPAAFDFTDPLGLGQDSQVLAAGGSLGFDPFNAPTPEVIQPDGVVPADPSLLPLPVAPSTIPTSTVEAIGKEKAGALLSQPVNGRSTSKFGMRFHPVLRVYKLHTGHDWAAPCGTPVGAAAAGTVVRTGWAGGNGVQVKVDHGMLGGYRVVTTYNHLSSIGVKVGQKVGALQGVGRVGNTGYSTGCHLHFEVIVNGQFTDPLPWLNGKPGMVDLSKMGAIVPGSPLSPLSPTALPSPSLPTASVPGLSPSPSAKPSTSEAPPAPSPGDTSVASPTPSASPSTKPSPSASPSPSPSKSPSQKPVPSPTPTVTAPTTPTPTVTPDPTGEPTTTPPVEEPSPTGSPSEPKPDPTTDPAPTGSPSTPSTPPSGSADPKPSPTQTKSESTPSAPAAPSAAPTTETAAAEG